MTGEQVGQFGTQGNIREAFNPAKMTLGSVPKNVIGGVSESFTNIAVITFEKTLPGPARDEALGLLYKSYLAQVGTIVTHWNGKDN